jgi:hypothetical protein
LKNFLRLNLHYGLVCVISCQHSKQYSPFIWNISAGLT